MYSNSIWPEVQRHRLYSRSKGFVGGGGGIANRRPRGKLLKALSLRHDTGPEKARTQVPQHFMLQVHFFHGAGEPHVFLLATLTPADRVRSTIRFVFETQKYVLKCSVIDLVLL